MPRDSRKRDLTSPPQTEAPFRILALYDSARASEEAARASSIVVRELGEGAAVDRCSWNLESLEKAETREFAAGEAARADLIVIAVSAAEPTEALKEWVAQWEKNRRLSSGLLALIPSGTAAEMHALESYFHETSITANMDFLCRKGRRF